MITIKNISNKISKKVKISLLIGIIAILIVSIVFTLRDIISNLETIETFEYEFVNDINNNVDNTIEDNELDEFDNIIDISQLEEFKKEDEPKKPTTTTNKNNNINNSTNKTSGPTYYIKVNYGAQVVTIYKKDDNGNYTIPVKAMVCSTGTATPTSGVYSIPARWEWLRLQGNVWGHYVTQIKGNILFHSVPYLTKGDNGSLEYWEYDKLGTKASLGCVRLQVIDAKWIYDNCSKGTKVEFYSNSNPGPLGKPSAKKISNSGEELRNWDPTDPASNNPWKNQNKAPTNNNENTQKPNTTTETIPNNTTTNTVNNTITNTTVNNTPSTDTNKNTISQNTIIQNNINTSSSNNDNKQNTEITDKEVSTEDKSTNPLLENTI